MKFGTTHSLLRLFVNGKGVSSWSADDGVAARLHIANIDFCLLDLFLLMEKRMMRRVGLETGDWACKSQSYDDTDGGGGGF
jgi:hypothetical protein